MSQQFLFNNTLSSLARGYNKELLRQADRFLDNFDHSNESNDNDIESNKNEDEKYPNRFLFFNKSIKKISYVPVLSNKFYIFGYGLNTMITEEVIKIFQQVICFNEWSEKDDVIAISDIDIHWSKIKPSNWIAVSKEEYLRQIGNPEIPPCALRDPEVNDDSDSDTSEDDDYDSDSSEDNDSDSDTSEDDDSDSDTSEDDDSDSDSSSDYVSDSEYPDSDSSDD
jgi:hypothetical protein